MHGIASRRRPLPTHFIFGGVSLRRRALFWARALGESARRSGRRRSRSTQDRRGLTLSPSRSGKGRWRSLGAAQIMEVLFTAAVAAAAQYVGRLRRYAELRTGQPCSERGRGEGREHCETPPPPPLPPHAHLHGLHALPPSPPSRQKDKNSVQLSPTFIPFSRENDIHSERPWP